MFNLHAKCLNLYCQFDLTFYFSSKYVQSCINGLSLSETWQCQDEVFKFVLPSLLISSFCFIHFSMLHAFSLYFLFFYPYFPHNFSTSEEQLLSYHYLKSLIDSLIYHKSPLFIVSFVLHFNQLHSSIFWSYFELYLKLTTVWYPCLYVWG